MGFPKIHESEYRFCLIMWEHEPVTAVELVKLLYTDLISGREMEAKGVQIPAFGCYWLCRNKQ